MARTMVKSGKGEKLGEIDDQPKQAIAYDAKGKRMGRFDKKANTTYDAAGKVVGKGNQLRGLFPK